MEHRVEIVKVGEIQPHPNADRLELTKVFDYPCIIVKGSMKAGDLGIFVPVDSVVPAHKYWTFVHGDKDDTRHRRVKAKKLRGIYSEGILVPLADFVASDLSAKPGLSEDAIKEGDNVADQLGIKKYLPPPPKVYHAGNQRQGKPKFSIPDFPKYTEIENIRRWPEVLEFNEPVVVHEKIHGANARYGWVHVEPVGWFNKAVAWLQKVIGIHHEREFIVGSHAVIRANTGHNEHDWHGGDLWWKAAKKYDLAKKLEAYPDKIVFGEIYGDVQDLKYSHGPGEYSAVFFDVWDAKERRYMNWLDAETFIQNVLGLPTPPVLFAGPWCPDFKDELVTGKTVLGGGVHMREGFVVKPLQERKAGPGRVILKAINPDYLLREGGTEGK